MKKTKKTQKSSKKMTNEEIEEVLPTIEVVAKTLANGFTFGYYDREDIIQEAIQIGLEAMYGYDNTRPLQAFMFTTIRNGLINFKRKHYKRADIPCYKCEFYDKSYECSTNQCAKFEDKYECDLLRKWQIRNEAKRDLVEPNVHYKDDLYQHNKNHIQSEEYESEIDIREVIEKIKDQFPPHMREDLLKFLDGIKLPSNKEDKILKESARIINGKKEE